MASAVPNLTQKSIESFCGSLNHQYLASCCYFETHFHQNNFSHPYSLIWRQCCSVLALIWLLPTSWQNKMMNYVFKRRIKRMQSIPPDCIKEAARSAINPYCLWNTTNMASNGLQQVLLMYRCANWKYEVQHQN